MGQLFRMIIVMMSFPGDSQGMSGCLQFELQKNKAKQNPFHLVSWANPLPHWKEEDWTISDIWATEGAWLPGVPPPSSVCSWTVDPPAHISVLALLLLQESGEGIFSLLLIGFVWGICLPTVQCYCTDCGINLWGVHNRPPAGSNCLLRSRLGSTIRNPDWTIGGLAGSLLVCADRVRNAGWLLSCSGYFCFLNCSFGVGPPGHSLFAGWPSSSQIFWTEARCLPL